MAQGQTSNNTGMPSLNDNVAPGVARSPKVVIDQKGKQPVYAPGQKGMNVRHTNPNPKVEHHHFEA